VQNCRSSTTWLSATEVMKSHQSLQKHAEPGDPDKQRGRPWYTKMKQRPRPVVLKLFCALTPN